MTNFLLSPTVVKTVDKNTFFVVAEGGVDVLAILPTIQKKTDNIREVRYYRSGGVRQGVAQRSQRLSTLKSRGKLDYELSGKHARHYQKGGGGVEEERDLGHLNMRTRTRPILIRRATPSSQNPAVPLQEEAGRHGLHPLRETAHIRIE
jgi:hypothetical protein